MMDRMFGDDSFLDEVDSPGQAEQCVEYLALNERKFVKELQDEGLDYDEIQNVLKTIWGNLMQSCQRVGYSDSLIDGKKIQYSL